MERKVLTYKDVEEAKKYIGKHGLFGDNLAKVSKGEVQSPDVRRGVLLYADVDRPAYPFEAENATARSQFFSPDPEPIEKWVPFTAEDWAIYMGKIVEAAGSKGTHHRMVTRHTSHGVYLDGNFVDFAEFLTNWILVDGTPCGKKILTESPE